MDHNALRSWHVTMYKFVTSTVRCGLGNNATIQKTSLDGLTSQYVQHSKASV